MRGGLGFAGLRSPAEQAAEIYAAQLQRPPFDVRLFGAKGDGSHDDTAAIRAAVAALPAEGGAVLFPPGRYVVTGEIEIAKSGVVVQGAGPRHGKLFKAAAFQASYIEIGANIAGSVFRFAEVDGNPSRGCAIRDLSFNGNDRAHTVDACVHVESSDQFLLENVDAQKVAGGVLKTSRCVKSVFRALDVIECGDTSKPSVWVAGTSSTVATQGCVFEACKVEINYNSTYLQIDDSNPSNKFIGCVLESADSIAASEQTYVTDAGTGNQFTAIHMNKNGGTDARFIASGNVTLITNLSSRGEHGGIGLLVSGNRVVASGLNITGSAGESVYAIEVSGDYNKVAQSKINLLGGVHITAAGLGNTVADVTVDQGRLRAIYDEGTETEIANVHADRLATAGPVVELAGTKGDLRGGHLRDATSATEGVLLSGGSNRCVGVRVEELDAGHGIRCAENRSVIDGNFISSVGKHGIFIDATEPFRVCGNVVIDAGTSMASTFDGISFQSSADKTTGGVCNGNRIFDAVATHRNAIFVTDNAGSPRYDFWTFVANNVRSGGAISVSAGSNVIANNRS